MKKPAHSTFRIERIDGGWLDLAEWLEPLTANVKVATVLGSTPSSSDTVESNGAADEAVLNKNI
jgi:hypothetical protein